MSPVERLGGLLAVAERLLDKNDAVRAQKIVEEVERQLPSLAGNNDNDAKSLPESAGEIRARLGQADRAARLVTGSGTTSVSNLLAIAGKYPAAASLREEAWREAKRVNELSGWQSLMEDAIRRGDPAEISRTAQRIGEVIDGASDRNLSGWATPLAQVLLTAGFPDLSARLVSPWPQWLNGKEATVQSGLVDPVILKANIVDRLIPVLAGLARDRDVEMAVGAVSEPAIRSQCLSKAATEYFRLGRRDLAEKLDTEALVLAVSSPTRESKLRGYHDGALHNLALVRADRGDIDGALIATAKLLDEAKVRQVTVYLVQRAIDAGHGPVAAPATETLEQRATAAQDVPSLLVAANAWYVAGEKDKAGKSLAQAMKLVDAIQTPLTGNDLGLAAELMWRLGGAGKAEAIIGIVEQIGVNDPVAIDHLIEIIRPISPAVAVGLSGRQSEVERRIADLANIAIQIAADTK